MPLFPRTEPELRDLIAYVVARSRAHGVTLNRTKLVKLLYLMDVERARARREPITGLVWVFFHYGPWAYELIDELEAMEGTVLAVRPWHESVLYMGASDAPDGEEWPATTKAMADRVIEKYAPLETNELLDYVYFHTGPMIDAKRGEQLNMRAARNDPLERRQPPLAAPRPSQDLHDRLREWRTATRRKLSPLPANEPRVMFDDPSDDVRGGTGVSGRLHAPEGSDA